ncbi:hypothetical protein IMX26_16790 [Clostridium sp. 'deep sea']|uniref:hypothetical protein n=1 Tax=Clostridium sp. 'deep sea' TaxID=2779445 RepID=UPI0018967F51|nr:hypothetical protein [Clostridium sp. 'deep sea']QOR35092.1 hypothetical protein IMX26_16790 [Clostridium sp. 'deep sea']
MGFSQIFWGFIFLLNFYFNGFNILPSFIGYILIYNGLNKLLLYNDYFHKASKSAFFLIFLFIPNIIENSEMLLGESLTLIISVITTIVGIYFMFNLCLGIEDFAKSKNNYEIANKAKFYWQMYLVVGILSLLLCFGILGVIVMPSFCVMTIIYTIGVLMFLYKCKHELNA